MKIYSASFRYRSVDGQLREARRDIPSTSLRDARITAKNIAEQNGWWFMKVVTGSRAW
ncbi:hypothetical protein LCGC14_1879160 [marine sediment metagenome]|uniref:Uncharacterized protein n=1 Tax=marine sediment metagenome TaxID=412755 RepID=A0A0F9GQW5_9ZZZZ